MKNKLRFKILIAVFSLMLIFSVGAFAQKSKKTNCAQVTDDALVMQIYDKLKVKYAGQISHINVRISYGVVTIEGWATTKKVVKDIGNIVKKVTCVKTVNNKLTIGVGGGCGPGLKQCGDICIPEKETCNICRADPTIVCK